MFGNVEDYNLETAARAKVRRANPNSPLAQRKSKSLAKSEAVTLEPI